MNTRTIYSLVLAGVLFVAAPAAHAMTLEQAVAKIDSMIAEMQALRAELATLTPSAVPAVPTPAVQGAQTGPVFTESLEYGETNDDIFRIQELLATDSEIYPDGIVSGFFGPKTQDAIRRFQARFGLDTVGVIGPSTKALLELFVSAYPDGNYPEGVLVKKPVASVPATTPVVSDVVVSAPAPTAPTTATGLLSRISVEEDDEEYIVRSYKKNGDRNRDLILYPESFDELVEEIADKLVVTEAEVRGLLDEGHVPFGSSSRRGGDEDDATDAIEDADDMIDRARDEIKEADDDGDDIDDADELYDEARDKYKRARDEFDDEDYDKAIELAEEAEELAEEAIDEIGGSSGSSRGDADEIDEINVDVDEDESEVTVEYEDGDEEDFDVEDTDRDDIIEEIADELDISEGDVRDLVEFDFGDIDRVLAIIEDGTTRVRVYYDSGVDEKLVFDDEIGDLDDLSEEISDELDLDRLDVKLALDIDDRS